MDRVLASSESFLSSYDAVHSNSSPSPVLSSCKWSKPFSRWIKINTDAACGEGSSGVGLGVAARNWDGQVVLAKAVFRPYLCGVMLAEANAILEGVKLALNEGYENVIVESDALSVIELLASKEPLRNELGTVIGDILGLGECLSVKFQFISRDGNRVAHSLASFAFSSQHSEIWDSVFPGWLLESCYLDLI